MAITEIKPFDSSALESTSGKLKASRATTELAALHRQAQKSVTIKSLLSTAALVIAAAIVLFSSTISFLGTGIGLFILALFMLRDNQKERKRINHLFRTAKAALTQI